MRAEAKVSEYMSEHKDAGKSKSKSESESPEKCRQV